MARPAPEALEQTLEPTSRRTAETETGDRTGPSDRPAPSGALLLFGGTDRLSAHLAAALGKGRAVHLETERALPPVPEADAAIYLAASRGGTRAVAPDLLDAGAIFEQVAASPIRHLVVLSSSAVHEPSAHHPQNLDEDRMAPRRTGASFAHAWQELEGRVAEVCTGASGIGVTILRPTPVLTPGGEDFWSRLFRRPVAFTVPGHDPMLQLLAADDLARAVEAALASPPPPDTPRLLHVAPTANAPLRRALKHSRTVALPIPRTLQRPVRALLSPLAMAAPSEQLESLRYPSTVDGDAIRRHLDVSPKLSSLEALDVLLRRSMNEKGPQPEIDPFGLDIPYIHRLGSTLFRFLHDLWWRIEYRGLEHVPTTGPAVLAGVHRGFQPWDGVMVMHKVAQKHRRYMRFLVHPTLLKHAFLAPYMQKLGGVPACRENGDWVLRRGELMAIFPEGIRGAFKVYDRHIYELGSFGRDEYVRFALRHGVPIVPFVTVGSAEIFPIWKRLEWSWWRRTMEWPYFPITPTMGTVPLPSKWHTRFLEPIPTHDHPPSAAEDSRLVRRISGQVRRRMTEALDEMLKRRRHIFRGKVFRDDEP